MATGNEVSPCTLTPFTPLPHLFAPDLESAVVRKKMFFFEIPIDVSVENLYQIEKDKANQP